MRTAVFLFSASCIFLALPAAADTREQAVERARQGDYASAITTLREITAKDSSNVGAFHDLLIILGWAEHDQEILSLADRIDTDIASAVVLETVAKAARNLGNFEQSIEWYRLTVSKSPQRLDGHFGLAMALADSGQTERALESLGAAPASVDGEVQLMLTEAYVRRSAGDLVPAMAIYDRVLFRSPVHRDALRGKIEVMQRLLLPKQALELASLNPGILSEEELAALHSDWAAVQIRWALQSAAPPAETRQRVEQALEEIQRTAKRFDSSESVQRSSRFDRIVALASSNQARQATDEFELLDDSIDAIPDYVLRSAAGAYMQQRKPEKARQLLQSALQRAPRDFELNREMFYVHVDLEEHREAIQLAEAMRLDQPIWHESPGSTDTAVNPVRLQAELLAGLSLAFAEQLPQAQRRFEELLSRAPHNTDLRLELASVYGQRGWTDQAQFEYGQIIAVEPGLIAAHVGHANTLLDQRRFELADDSIKQLLRESPARQDVMRLARRWQQQTSNRFYVESGFGNSSGVQFGSEQYGIDAAFFFKPLAYRWRPFLRLSEHSAEFPEGDGTRRRLGAGFEYLGVDWLGSFEAHTDREGNNDAGASASIEWLPDDYWSVAATVETSSAEVPLRGYRVGVDGERMGMRLQYRFSESRELSIGAGYLRLNDGNTRHDWLALARQRLFTGPAYQLDLEAEIFASRNSKQDVAYYSPRSDSSAILAVANRWRTYRRYGFAFRQQLNAGYGYYQQRTFGSQPIYFAHYIADLDVNDKLSFRFGARRSRNVYDGGSEDASYYTLDLAGSF